MRATTASTASSTGCATTARPTAPARRSSAPSVGRDGRRPGRFRQRRALRRGQDHHDPRGREPHVRRGRLRLQRHRMATPSSAVRITSLPAAGTLDARPDVGRDPRPGDPGRRSRRARLHAGRRRPRRSATPASPSRSSDDGGTTNGGVDVDPSANAITFDVTVGQRRPGGRQRDHHDE